MSVNTSLFRQFRALVGLPSVYIADVVQVLDDDTSLVRLLGPDGLTPYAGNLAAGGLVRVRGASVEAGKRAFVRAGVIESEAPSGPVSTIEVGRVVNVPAAP